MLLSHRLEDKFTAGHKDAWKSCAEVPATEGSKDGVSHSSTCSLLLMMLRGVRKNVIALQMKQSLKSYSWWFIFFL